LEGAVSHNARRSQCPNKTVFSLNCLTRDSSAKRVLAIVEASVCPSIRPSVCHTLELCQNSAN